MSLSPHSLLRLNLGVSNPHLSGNLNLDADSGYICDGMERKVTDVNISHSPFARKPEELAKIFNDFAHHFYIEDVGGTGHTTGAREAVDGKGAEQVLYGVCDAAAASRRKEWPE